MFVYTIQPVVMGLSNGFDNRYDNRVERIGLLFVQHGCQTATILSTGCQTRFDNRDERTAVRSNRLYTRYSRLQTGCQTGLTTG